MKSKTKCKIIMISGCLLGALMWGEQADFVWGGAIAIPLIIALSLFLDLIFVFIKQDDSKTSLNPGNINTKANYDYYVEPCQLCIERDNPEQRHLIDDCGWCNDSDTFYMSSNDYSGEIIKIDGEIGYPYHNNPHVNRQYFKDGTHVEELNGTNPQNNIAKNNDKPKRRSLLGSGIFQFILFYALSFIICDVFWKIYV